MVYETGCIIPIIIKLLYTVKAVNINFEHLCQNSKKTPWQLPWGSWKGFVKSTLFIFLAIYLSFCKNLAERTLFRKPAVAGVLEWGKAMCFVLSGQYNCNYAKISLKCLFPAILTKSLIFLIKFDRSKE